MTVLLDQQVFPKGSPLVPDVSRAILNITQGSKMVGIEKKWIGYEDKCQEQDSLLSSHRLNFRSFEGLFLITGLTSVISALIYLLWLGLEKFNIPVLVKAMVSKYFKKIETKALIFKRRTAPVCPGSPTSMDANSSVIITSFSQSPGSPSSIEEYIIETDKDD